MKKRPVNDPRSRDIWQLRVELLDVQPGVWRRLLAPATITLPKLHRVLQAVLGWTDSHLHEFVISGKHYGLPVPDWIDQLPMIDERRVVLGKVLAPEVRSFNYLYDFGDGWRHVVLIEHRDLQMLPEQPVLQCIAGENACPPEDVGGAPGYAEFLEAIANPRHPEHGDYLAWIGGSFDARRFDREAANRILGGIRI